MEIDDVKAEILERFKGKPMSLYCSVLTLGSESRIAAEFWGYAGAEKRRITGNSWAELLDAAEHQLTLNERREAAGMDLIALGA